MVTSPDNRLCLVKFKAHPFEEDLHHSTHWEVLGEIRSLSEEPIETDTIVLAKLIEKGNDLSVIVQYDGWLIALKVLREISGAPTERHRSDIMRKQLLPEGSNKRQNNHMTSRFDYDVLR